MGGVIETLELRQYHRAVMFEGFQGLSARLPRDIKRRHPLGLMIAVEMIREGLGFPLSTPPCRSSFRKQPLLPVCMAFTPTSICRETQPHREKSFTKLIK